MHLLASRCESRAVLPRSTITCLVSLLALTVVLHVVAQTFPISTYTIADGLAHNGINQILQDDAGYLWVATGEGLSRFDGYSFKNYGNDDGLPSSYINDVTFDRDGRLWVAINDGGIARFLEDPSEQDPTGKKKFIAFSVSDLPRAKNVGRIVFDADNRLWCATEGGVFRARRSEVGDYDFELVAPDGDSKNSREAFVDRRGRLWFGLIGRVLKIEDGRIEYIFLESGRNAHVTGIAEMPDGRIIVSTSLSVYDLSEPEQAPKKLELKLEPDQSVQTVASDGKNGLWIGTNAGLMHYQDGRLELYTRRNGLGADSVWVVFVDRENSVWLGTRGAGISHRTNDAVISYPSTSSKPHVLLMDRDGSVYIQSGCQPEPTRLAKLGDTGPAEVPFPEIRTDGCNRPQFLPISDGRWLVTSGGELKMLSGPGDPNGRRIELPDGSLVQRAVMSYEDQDQNIWLSATDRNLYVLNLRDGPTLRLALAASDVGASMMLRHASGTLWLAHNVFLGRFRDGNVTAIENINAVERIQPRALFEDSKGRMWIGTRFDGALYTEDPDADVPTFNSVTMSNGLGSNSVWSIAEDSSGRIYLGTGRGLYRFDVTTGAVRPFGSVDGVPESAIQHMLKDRSDFLWVATDGGVLRIDPTAIDRDQHPPAIRISGVGVEDESVGISERGASEITLPELAADRNSVSIKFVGLNLKGERSLSYRYLLEGYDKDWSPATKQREVNFANLGPGSYRFLVKAIDQQGVESERPAVLQFQILPPFWQRWWFITLAVIGIGAALYGLYRLRMNRAVELERVRTRIATDLHDDIGANLTRIALMSEVLKQQGSNGASADMLPSIANIARESVASMNDIVWAISPEHDRVLDLTRRMRQHAEEVFTIRDIDVDFVSDAVDSELKLPVGVRRDVLLIFKEAVNNAARHSDCTKVAIDFTCSNSRLQLKISDNGRGFGVTSEREGHGLTSMQRRATSLGGELDIRSAEGSGTVVDFEMPL